MVLLCGCISSMVFAILAARPRVSKLVVSEQDMMTGKVNLLYFNNFQSVTEEKYAEAMWNLIEDTKSIYDMMSKQLYNMGIVLTRKYWLLRISYGVFLFGIVLTGFLYITRFMMS